ncbi:MAG: hypothetical protein SOV58_00275 [Candidatus Enteromonas sp.]|nr:hypothetical protein [Candidatus Enteromonas sp.]
MKRITRIAILALASASLLLSSCSPEGGNNTPNPPSLSLVDGQENVWLDRYEEMDVPLVEIKEGIVYQSSDESVVSVKNHRLYAQGVGSANVKITLGSTVLNLSVRVRDSGVKPTIAFRSIEAFLNTETSLPQEVSYNGKTMETEIQYTVQIANPDIATYANGQMKGLALGSTQCDISAEWKGLTLARRDIPLTVKERLYISASTEEIQLYKTTTKLGYFDLDAVAYDRGVPQETPVTYEIEEGHENVRLEGNRVYAKQEGEAKIKASYEVDSSRAELMISVHVGPNYVESDFYNPKESNNTLVPGVDPEGKRDEVYYYAPAPNVSDATCFASHVVEESRGKTIVDLYREGKRYLTYDVYWSSNENMMVGTSSLTSWIGVGAYFRKDYLSILKDGKVTNVLEKDTWVTMVYDLRELWLKNYGLSSYFFFFINDVNGKAYLTKPRFYLDDSFLPSENRVYEKKDGYVQATNDEFDVHVPVSKGYRKGADAPSVVVLPEEVPTYGPAGKSVGGRDSSYEYRTKISSPVKNSLVVSTSMNESYDDSHYRMSKYGTYFSFDIYPTKESTLRFQINGDSPDFLAQLKVGETSLAAYEDWLIVYSGQERQNTLEANKWQTVVYAFADSYVEDCYSASMTFASADASDCVYIDNCRYYAASDFLPSAYAPERRRPIATSDSTSVTRLTEGSLKGAYAVEGNGETHSSFTELGKDEQFFDKKYRYVRFDLRFSEEVTSYRIAASAASGIEPIDATLTLGEAPSQQITLLDEKGMNVSKVAANAWYTVYVPFHGKGNVESPSFECIAQGSKKATTYIRYYGFAYDVYSFFLRQDQSVAAEYCSLEYQTDGDFEGSYRYENATSGELSGEGQNWGEAGVYFETVNAPDCASSGSFFANGYRFLKFGIYFESSVRSFSLRVTCDRNFSSYWLRNIAVGAPLPNELIFISENNERVASVKSGTWYTMVIPMDYTSADNGYSCVTLYTNGGSKEAPSVLYLRDLEFAKEVAIPDYEVSLIRSKGVYPSLVSCEKLSDGSYRYLNGTAGEVEGENRNWGESGVFFHDVTNPNALTGEESTGRFFREGYHYIQVEVNFIRCSSFSIRVSGLEGLEEYWVREIGFGETIDSSLLLYDASGTKVSSLSKNQWYTLYIPVLYTEGYANWTDVLIYTNGGSSANPSEMLLRNPVFLKERVGF